MSSTRPSVAPPGTLRQVTGLPSRSSSQLRESASSACMSSDDRELSIRCVTPWDPIVKREGSRRRRASGDTKNRRPTKSVVTKKNAAMPRSASAGAAHSTAPRQPSSKQSTTPPPPFPALARAGNGGGGVVLCFDDGWRGAVECAAPALAERGMAAFFFVTTDFVGRRFFVSPDALRRLDPSLFTIGSHGVTHRMLSSLSSDDIHAELADSRSWLEDLLGRPVTCLSVPGGATDGRVLDIAAAAGYEHVFTSALGVNPTADGRRGIARIGVRQDTNPTVLRRWLTGDLRREGARAALLAVPKRLRGMRTYSRLRRLLLGEAIGREHVFEP